VTQITQEVTIVGPEVEKYVPLAESQLAAGIPQGMRQLAEAIEREAS
jgi:hypothetical protein